MGNAVGDGEIDAVLGHVTFGTRVVVIGWVALQTAALHLHLMDRLPGAGDDLSDSAHGLGVRSDHREGPQVM